MRHLVVCCDGTWNTPDQEKSGVPAPTNVRRLHNALAPERDPAVALRPQRAEHRRHAHRRRSLRAPEGRPGEREKLSQWSGGGLGHVLMLPGAEGGRSRYAESAVRNSSM